MKILLLIIMLELVGIGFLLSPLSVEQPDKLGGSEPGILPNQPDTLTVLSPQEEDALNRLHHAVFSEW